MDLAKKFSLSDAEKGVWIEVDGEECFCLRASSSPAYHQAYGDFLVEHHDSEKIDQRLARRHALAHGGIAGWKNVVVGGSPVGEFTPERALALFESWPKLEIFLQQECNRLTLRANQEAEEAEKNSEGSSAGGEPTDRS